MARNNKQLDPQIVEAEENFLIDFQFLVQDLINSRKLSRAELAQRAGISKARLSQILSAEANPTVRTFARLFHALNAKVVPKCVVKTREVPVPEKSQWIWQANKIQNLDPVEPRLTKRSGEGGSDWRGASNDNYFDVAGETKSLVA